MNTNEKELKTLEDLWKYSNEEVPEEMVLESELKAEAIKIFKNLQGPETIYPIILNNFPDSQKGEIAKDKWNHTDFRYGAEYGMLAMLNWLMNLSEGDLK